MAKHGIFYAATCALLACRFDPAGLPLRDDGGVIPDAAIDADRLDAGPCPEPLVAALRIGEVSEPPPAGQPYMHALVGDVIELSAAGSCTQAGTLAYTWQITPVDGTRATALPDLESETITIYPMQPDNYVVTLTVTNGVDMVERTVLGIVAHGWTRRDGLPGGQDIRDLTIGGETLWIAHKDGAFGLPFDAGSGFVPLTDITAGVSVATNIGAVHYGAEGSVLWLAEDGSGSGVWRVSLATTPALVTEVAFDHELALGEAARVLDIGPAAPGVLVGTDKGLTISADTLAFVGDLELGGSAAAHAVAAGGGRRWAGGTRLLAIDQGVEHDVFSQGDNKIRALAVDEGKDELWVGSDASGVARVSNGEPFEIKAVYGTASGTLPVDRIRALAVETTGPYAGDAWAATSAGVARYIRARDAWLLMTTSHGLAMRTDVRAIAIDERRRVIYAGTKTGLVSLEVRIDP